jgi:dCTP deaminase
MSVLVDSEIVQMVRTGRLGITPFDYKLLQPASYDITLGDEFALFKGLGHGWGENSVVVDTREDVSPHMRKFKAKDEFWLSPQQFALATSVERFRIPTTIVGRLEGKSSLARLGLIIHITAGFFDPGFEGYATLELANLSPHPIILYPGMPIGQMSFMLLRTKPDRAYGSKGLGSKYQHQTGATISRYHENFRE